jgi:hypothetical protein
MSTIKRAAHGPALALFALALAFLWALRLHDLAGLSQPWAINDASRALYQPIRLLAGQWPYLDFSVDNYGPGVMALRQLSAGSPVT